MDSLIAQTRPNAHETIECWDDDEDLQLHDNIQFRTASSAGSIANSSVRPAGHRDSISSRRSARSDLESNAGDEDWQVLLPDNDEISKEEILASATHAGIPIPPDVPRSALFGGAIKRLAERKPKRAFVDDWSDDVELPGPDLVLELKTPRDTSFPESIPQVSSAATSPIKTTTSPSWNEDISIRLESAAATLERTRDEDNAPFEQNVPTLKVPTPRSPQKTASSVIDDNPVEGEADDYGQDLELPPDHQPLQLSHHRKEGPVSSPTLEDLDLDWSEGSIGVRVGGTTRDCRSLPSSSISIASPSVSSCITGESEEDGLDGLVFPEGPLDFSTSLKKRQEDQVTADATEQGTTRAASSLQDADDFFSGLEVDNGRAFASGKLSLNPNVKRTTEWPSSPTRRSEKTLTFTNSTGSPRTRIPRLSGHERTHSTSLETVSESGAPLSKFQRSQSRLGHASQSSISSTPSAGAVSTSPTPSVSGRRLLGPRSSRDSATTGESKTPSRHLRTKRSMPTIRGSTDSATIAQPSHRPPPRPEGSARPAFNELTTPIERTAVDGRLPARRAQASFVPASTSERQSHNASLKSYRSSRRTNSDSASDVFGSQGTLSRLSRPGRPQHFRLSLDETCTEATTGGPAKRTLTRPTRRRNFGDGTELASFDDLPTSTSEESKFIKTPSGRGASRSVRSRPSQSRIIPPRESPAQTSTPPSASKLDPTPRFARDTNASRNAREQRIASMNSRNREGSPLTSSNSTWKAHPIPRISRGTVPLRSGKTRPANKPTSKPHLIKPMGAGVQEAKCKKALNRFPPLFWSLKLTVHSLQL